MELKVLQSNQSRIKEKLKTFEWDYQNLWI